MTRLVLALLTLLCSLTSTAHGQTANQWRDDALAIPAIINDDYAYLDRLPGGKFVLTPKLQAEANAVSDEKSLLAFAERALFLLADHHAITGGSFKDSWALVPSYSDLWIERQAGRYRITAVREGSAAETAGIHAGAEFIGVGGRPVADAVAAFWSDLGVSQATDEQAGYAARTLAAGRRDRAREIQVRNPDGGDLSVTLASRYDLPHSEEAIQLVSEGNADRIVLLDSLGKSDTVGAFDQAMAKIGPRRQLIIDLRNTAGGGNSTVARAIMGWFVTKATAYQIHRSPAEERQTGIARQWIEQVLPRDGKYRRGPVTVLVGRWTGSMGEGLAIGLSSTGARVSGDPMAHLLGAVEDIRLPKSGLAIKIPTERLYTVDGIPRENFIPEPVSRRNAARD